MKITTYDMTPNKAKPTDLRWWTLDTGVHESVFESAKGIENLNSERKHENLINARLYSNKEFLQLSPNPKTNIIRSFVDSGRLTFNIIKSCVDTACNKISQNKPRPSFITSGGDYKLKNKAQQLSKFIEGLFDSEGVYQLSQTVFRDSLIFNSGIIKVFNDGESVKFERVMNDELLLDDIDAYYGKPRQIHQRRFVSKDVLIDKFPKFKDLINAAESSFGEDSAVNPDMVVVIESWHLKSGSKARDGKRVISISNTVLLEEKYDRDEFPFVFLNWDEPLVGFWGNGLVSELIGIQVEINKILRNIQVAQAVCSTPRVFVENGASINGAALKGDPKGLSIVRYTGNPPTFQTPSAMPSEVYSHLERLSNKAYEITGISQLSASAKKPSGIDSAVALREYEDIQSERFQLVGKRYERFFIQLAKLAVLEAKELKESNPNFNVKVNVKGGLEFIKWSEVELDEDKYILKCYPTSILPSSPAGRLQTVQELMQDGFIAKEQALALLDFPDLERSMSLDTSAYDDAMRSVEMIVAGEGYDTPEPYQNLGLCVVIAQSMYLKAKNNKVPEDRLELLRRYMDECERLIKEKTPE